VIGVAGAAGEIDGFVDIEGDLVGELEQSELRGRFERAAAGGDGRGGDELHGGDAARDAGDEGVLHMLFDAEGAGGEGGFSEAAAEEVVGVFVFMPEISERGFALGERRHDLVEMIALEIRTDDEGRGGLRKDVGEETLGLSPLGGGEIAERGAGGEDDGIEAVLLHELAGEVDAVGTFFDGDGDDVLGTVSERGDGRGEWSVAGGGGSGGWFGRRGSRCFVVLFLRVQGESWG